MKIKITPNTSNIENEGADYSATSMINDGGSDSADSSNIFKSEYAFETPKTSKKEPHIAPKSIKILKYAENNNFMKVIRRYYLIVVSVLILVYSFVRPKGDKKILDELESLKTKYQKMKNELGDVRKVQNIDFNYAQIEYGACIDMQKTSLPYRYGLLGRRMGKHPSVVLQNYHERGNCFSFAGQQGIIAINLGKELLVSRIGIFYPQTANKKAFIRAFEVLDETNKVHGEFIYQGNGYEEFEINRKFKQIVLNIKSNSGNKKYTSVYKIYCFSKD